MSLTPELLLSFTTSPTTASLPHHTHVLTHIHTTILQDGLRVRAKGLLFLYQEWVGGEGTAPADPVRAVPPKEQLFLHSESRGRWGPLRQERLVSCHGLSQRLHPPTQAEL